MLEKDSELKSDSGALYKICHLMAKPARLLVSASEKWSRCSLPDYLLLLLLLVHSNTSNLQFASMCFTGSMLNWCRGLKWLVRGRWLMVHFNDCRPPMHQWHVIHLLQSSMLFTVQGKTYRTTEQCTRCAGAAPGGAPLHGWHLIHLISPCS